MKPSSRHIGAALQGIILGLLLVIAIIGLIVASGGGRLFIYEGF